MGDAQDTTARIRARDTKARRRATTIAESADIVAVTEASDWLNKLLSHADEENDALPLRLHAAQLQLRPGIEKAAAEMVELVTHLGQYTMEPEHEAAAQAAVAKFKSEVSALLEAKTQPHLRTALADWEKFTMPKVQEMLIKRDRTGNRISDERLDKIARMQQNEARTEADKESWEAMKPHRERVRQLEKDFNDKEAQLQAVEKAAEELVAQMETQAREARSQFAELQDRLDLTEQMWQKQKQRNVEIEKKMGSQLGEVEKALLREKEKLQAHQKKQMNAVSLMMGGDGKGKTLVEVLLALESALGVAGGAGECLSIFSTQSVQKLARPL